MEINPAHIARDLIEADVIEPFKAGTQNLTHAVIGHQKRFLPTHEDILALCAVLVVKIRLLGLLCKRPPCRESCPVLHIGFVGRTPRRMASLKGVLGPNNLSFEVGCQGWVIGGESCPKSESISATSRLPSSKDYAVPSIRR